MNFKRNYDWLIQVVRQLRKNAASVAAMYFLVVFILYLLWPISGLFLDHAVIFGIPFSFFLPVVVIPFFSWVALLSYARIADFIDRHSIETENE